MTKAECEILTWFAEMDPYGCAYSLSRREAKTIRAFLHNRRPRSEDATYWLKYFNNYWADSRFEEKSITGGKSFPMDDCDDGARFGAYCRTILAIEGIIIR